MNDTSELNEKKEDDPGEVVNPEVPLSRLQTPGSTQSGNTGFLKSGLIFVIFSLIFILSITGLLERPVGKIMLVEKVSDQNQEFLNSSLMSAVGHFTVLTMAKGGLSVISNMDADAKFMSAGVGIPIGKAFSGISETLDAIWRFFGYSMASITAQMAILKFFKLISFKILVPIGALLVAVSALGLVVIRRFGVALIIVGFILYALMPYTVYVGKFLFEESNMESSTVLSEDLGVLKEKVSDINIFSKKNLTLSGVKDSFSDMSASLSQSIDVVLSATVKYFSNLIIMFVLTPLFFYGVIYISTKKILAYVGMDHASERMDKGIIGTWGKMWKRRKPISGPPSSNAVERRA